MQAMKQLLRETEAANPKAWALTQQQIQSAKLKRTRLIREIEDLRSAIHEAQMHSQSHDGQQLISSCRASLPFHKAMSADCKLHHHACSF